MKHSGMAVGFRRPNRATPTARTVMTTVVTMRTLRKLRTRICSRPAWELAARTAATIWVRSAPVIGGGSERSGRSRWCAAPEGCSSLSFSRSTRALKLRSRMSSRSRWRSACARKLGSCP
nr:hypothetical protein GCM10020093_028400 [Planobispora longispora]